MKGKTIIVILSLLITIKMYSNTQIKPTIAVMKFQGNVSYEYTELVRETITNYLVEAKKYVVVERYQLDKAVQELKLAGSDLMESRNAVRIGKILSAKGIIVGTILEVNNQTTISARLVEVETGSIIRSVKQKITFRSDFNSVCRKIAYRVINANINTTTDSSSLYDFSSFKLNVNITGGTITTSKFYFIMGVELRLLIFLTITPGIGYQKLEGKKIPLSFKVSFYPFQGGEQYYIGRGLSIRPYLFTGITFGIPAVEDTKVSIQMPILTGCEFSIKNLFSAFIEFGITIILYEQREVYYKGGIGVKMYF